MFHYNHFLIKISISKLVCINYFHTYFMWLQAYWVTMVLSNYPHYIFQCYTLHLTSYQNLHECRNLSLGLATNTKACKVAGQKEAREWRKVWRNEPSHSQESFHFGSLESPWIPEFSKGNYKGQNPMNWWVFYIIEKLLKRRRLKWARMTHSDIWNTSYGQKKGQESNWQFDSRPLKVGNRPNFFAYKWCATYHWKALEKGYNFASDLISIEGLHIELWDPKVAGVSTLGISGLPFRNPETKCHLDVGLVERHKLYYKGEGDGFPQVWAVMSLLNPNLLVTCYSTKNVPTMH